MPVIKKYDKNFFKKWSTDMAYVLGFLFADGNLVITKRNTHFISFYTADKSLLESMRKVMSSDHKISLRKAKSGQVYRMQVGSKEWFNDLCKLGLMPNKTRRLSLPNIPDKYFSDFVRGYFDGDGNVWVGEIHKNREKPSLTIQVSFTSGCFSYLRDLRDVFHQKGVCGGSLYSPKNENFTRLTFSVKDALKISKIMYNAEHKLFLNRKRSVFEKFEKLRP